ncbi:MAG TPA: D-2-hydroxyacid dehydrogenase [Verrucomicrobiae bacterium]
MTSTALSKQHIVVLDGHTLNPGDLSWDDLKALGECVIHERIAADEVVKYAAEAELILTNKVSLPRDTMARLPKLRYIGVTATGYNIVDAVAARERNVTVTNVPAYGTPSVAQMTFALLLELTQHVGHHAQSVVEGRWTRSADWCYWERPLVELDGLTMGIVGLGRIGRAVADLAAAFGMKVVAHRRSRPQSEPGQIPLLDLDALFRQCDVVSLHCPLTPETKNLVNAARLSLMKPSAFLLNTSRGPLIDEPALAEALNAGRLAGAGLDVLSLEPPPADNPLLQAKNCLITPHLAWATRAARARLMSAAVANVRAFLMGKPQNVVN